MPDTLDATVIRDWCGLALEALGKAREGIDAINVYPVADGDTGTNLYFTLESATRAVEAVFTAHTAASGPVAGAPASPGPRLPAAGVPGPAARDAAPRPAVTPAPSGRTPAEPGSPGTAAERLAQVPAAPALPEVLRAMSHGALIGARGNSGTILAQLLRGMTEILAGTATAGGGQLREALRRAADLAYQAVAHPVEGTVLTVAAAAADAAERAQADAGAPEVARAAYKGACAALDATPGQLAALSRAGVVDAGGCGLVTVLGALLQALTGESPARTTAIRPAPDARTSTGAPPDEEWSAGALPRGAAGPATTRAPGRPDRAAAGQPADTEPPGAGGSGAGGRADVYGGVPMRGGRGAAGESAGTEPSMAAGSGTGFRAGGWSSPARSAGERTVRARPTRRDRCARARAHAPAGHPGSTGPPHGA